MATYLKFHALEQSPFEGPGSDRLVLATEALRRAFADIKTGLDEGSPRICLSGGPGIGKSSLARALPKLLGKEARCALIRDPSRDWARLKATIAKQLNLEAGQLSRASLCAARPDAKRLVLVVDQAEHLPAESLEQLDVLLGYRDDEGEQLVQCVMLASLEDAPRGRDVPLLWWLDQLTTRQLMMAPIPETGLRSYVDKHLKKAGAQDGQLFEDDALRAIHRYTGGVPGAVSALCEQLLDKAASAGTHTITASLVASVFGDAPSRWDPPADEDEALLGEPEPAPDAALEAPAEPPGSDEEPTLPQFGERRAVASTPLNRRAVEDPPADPFAGPEPELQVEPGLLPVDQANHYANESDFFAAPAPFEPEAPSMREPSIPLGGASPGSGRGARAVRNLIALAVLAVLAAVGHALWNDWAGQAPLQAWMEQAWSEHAWGGESERERATAPPKSAPSRAEADDPAKGIHPLVPPADRELARRSLALEDTQGREEDPAHEGLTSDLKLDLGDPADRAANPSASPEPAADPSLSLRDLYEIAEKQEAEPSETAPAPWTQQGPGTAPAAPAPQP